MPTGDVDRVTRAIQRFARSGAGDIKKLAGYSPPLFRLRVGAWRVLYRRERDRIVIRRVLARKDAYRD
jgi:mRNA-degrading endonuclease RelE of RelBE toxin-antitoxin system